MDDEDMTELDRNIMRYVGVKTPRAIAEMTGHTAEEVLRRKDTLLDEVDALTIDQQITKIMITLGRIATDAEDAAANADYRDKGPLYSAAVTALSHQVKQLNSLKKDNDSKVVELNRLRLQEMMRFFDEVIDRGSEKIARDNDLEKTVLISVFNSFIVDSARAVE